MRFSSVMLLTLVAACTTRQAPPPSEAEARAFLDEIVETAVSQDFEALCALGGGSCESFLTDPGGRDVPSDRPTVVGIRLVDQQTSGPRPRTGGYIVELCGQDLDGDPYLSEMLVFRDFAGELRAIEPLYWMGITIADDDSVGRELGSASDELCAGVTPQGFGVPPLPSARRLRLLPASDGVGERPTALFLAEKWDGVPGRPAVLADRLPPYSRPRDAPRARPALVSCARGRQPEKPEEAQRLAALGRVTELPTRGAPSSRESTHHPLPRPTDAHTYKEE